YLSDKDALMAKVRPDYLKSYGLIPELIGGVAIIGYLDELDVDGLESIITDPKNAVVTQYKRKMHIVEVDLIFEENSLDAISELAIERKAGARGLHSIIEERMVDIMFKVTSNDDIKKVVITRETIIDEKDPLIYDAEGNEITADQKSA